MPLLDSILRPFPGAQRSRRARFAWLSLLLAAPLALAAGFYAQSNLNRGLRPITISRPEAIRLARTLAAQNGVDTSSWSEHVAYDDQPINRLYFSSRRRGKGPDGKGPGKKGPRPADAPPPGRPPEPGDNSNPERRPPLLAPPSRVRVILLRPDFEARVTVDMGPTGFVTAYRVSGIDMSTMAGPLDEARKVAETELKEWLGDMALENLGQPEVSSTAESGYAGAHRFLWRVQPMRRSDLEFVFTFDVAGGRILFREVRPNFSDAFLQREVRTHQNITQPLGLVRVLSILVFLAFACYRYVRRSMEREAPHRRSLLLALALLLFGALILGLDPYSILGDGPEDRLRLFVFYLQLSLSFLAFSLQGAVLGISYGATEGDIREAWPGKLTSLDALLTGRVFSANVGASVLLGSLFGIVFFALHRGAYALLAPYQSLESIPYVKLAFNRAPLIVWLLNLPLVCLFQSVFCLLLPVALFRRYLRHPAVVWSLVFLCALLVGDMGGTAPAIDTPGYWITATVATLAVILPFYFADYLAMVVALTIATWLTSSVGLSSLLPFWRTGASLGAAAAGVVLVPFFYLAWRGRLYEEEEVRPEHAKNILERLSLQAELNAARQAQLRLLPEKPPAIAGLSIAAACTPAREVGGDFYDFFPLSGGRLGLFVAEGGNDGLASALTIALAKGFLLYESTETGDLEDTISRLDEALGGHLRRGTHQTSLALIVLDPAAGSLRLARLGLFPKAFLVSEGSVTELLASQSGHRASAALSINPGDMLFLCTDGVYRLCQQPSAQSIPVLLGTPGAHDANSLHRLIIERLHTLAGQACDDDLTTVLVRYEKATATALEGAA